MLLALVSLPLAAAHAGEGSKALSKCWEGNGHPEMSACLEQAVEQWEEKRRKAEERAQKEGAELDEGLDYRRVEAHRESSAAFDVYLEKECDRQMAWAAPGNGMGDFGRTCAIDLMAERIRMLQGQE